MDGNRVAAHSAEGRNGSEGPVSVYVLDDHDAVRARLVEYLGGVDGLDVTGWSGSTEEAINEIVRLRPRVALVDGRVGERSGLDVCRELATSAPDVSCVIITSAVALNWGLTEAARAGAVAFVVKRLRGFELIDVIFRVAKGERPIDADQIGRRVAVGQVEGANR